MDKPMDEKAVLYKYPQLISTTIVLICENCEKEHTVREWNKELGEKKNWLPLGDRLTNHIRALCGEECKKEWWAKQPVLDMGGEEE